MLFLGSFKDVLRKFQGYLNKVSRKFRKKVSRMNQESLNEVSFAFLLHESHRSYPSRRRACLPRKHVLVLFDFYFNGVKHKFWQKRNLKSFGGTRPPDPLELSKFETF